MKKGKPTKQPSEMDDDETLDHLFTKKGARVIKKQTETEPKRGIRPRKTKGNG